MLKISKGQSEAVNQRITDKTMTKRKRTKEHIMIYWSLHRRLKMNLTKHGSEHWSSRMLNIYRSTSEWVSDCCWNPPQQLFNYIMARTNYIQGHDDEVRFVLDQHAKLDLFIVIVKWSWLRANQSVLFILNDVCFTEMQYIPHL